MLNSLLPLATVLLSSGESWLSDVPLGQRQPTPQLVPHEPTTLALALVGIATVAIYLAATGWRLKKTNVAEQADGSTVQPPHHPPIKSKSSERQPSRGAA